ncbi:MAG TPA: PTS sugar transporter subunit IIA [Xanthobacteraceae bacterium]|jgi:PTS system nitrogen regulatory IIA component|nr:PTS sugar transporter subunit IIA [Xanthobacteraceae bacterium]
MHPADFLTVENSLIDVRASTKKELLVQLCVRAAVVLALDGDMLLSVVQNREELGSTGMGDGVALPHARIPELQKVFAILARLQKPLAFDAIDNRPVDIVCMLFLPAGRSGESLNALAAVARKLRDPEARDRLRQCTSAAALHREMVA